MYNLLIKLILLAAIGELGLSFTDISNCNSEQCVKRIERASRDILHIDWKPISVFPEEAKRFR